MEELHLLTPRLYLRPFAESDADGFYQLNANPEVLQFTGDRPFPDIAAALSFIQGYDHYQNYGYGRWAVIFRQTNSFIGFCGLKFHPEGQCTDLGFRFMQEYWGRGLATEAALACVKHAFTRLALPSLVGRVRQENQASIRVLEKIGMKRIRTFDFDGKPGYWYELDAQDWL